MTAATSSLGLAALMYGAHGWPVFPCTPRGKSPLTTNGFKDATADAAAIERQWQKQPDANVGLSCGRSGIVVIDIDPQHGGDASLEMLRWELGEEAFETVTALTGGGGQHIFYRAPEGVIVGNSAGRLGAGIDVRGSGGYVIAPPSIHASGERYVWQDGYAPHQVLLRDLPSGLATRLLRPSLERVDENVEKIPEGQRNDSLARIAGKLRHQGLSYNEMLASLKSINDERCQPPLEHEEVERIVRSISRHPQGRSLLGVFGRQRRLDLVPLSEIEPETTEWLWAGRIPRGKVTLLVGDPGVGKSLASLAIASALTRGQPLPGDSSASKAPSEVVIWNGEDGLGDTVRPRSEAAGADLARLHVVRGTFDENGRPQPFTLSDVDSLRAAVQSGGVSMVVIDPLAALLGAVDAHRDAEVRSKLQPLVELARDANVAVVVVMHLNKSSELRGLYRVGGSIGFVGLARSVLLAGTTADGRRVIASLKSNLGQMPPPVEYRIGKDGALDWGPLASDLDAEGLLGTASVGQARERERAEDVILATLADGPRAAANLENAVLGEGISKRTYDRGRAALREQGRIDSRRVGFGPGSQVEWFAVEEILSHTPPLASAA